MNEALITEFMENVCRKDAVVTLQVYMELCEVKRYHNIEYSYNSELKKIIITANKTKTGPSCAFVPNAVYDQLNFLQIHKTICSIPLSTIYLVIVHTDSTCVYYQLGNGLMEPTDTTAKHLKENKQEKLDSDLRKNKQFLEQSALYGIPISIKKPESNQENT